VNFIHQRINRSRSDLYNSTRNVGTILSHLIVQTKH